MPDGQFAAPPLGVTFADVQQAATRIAGIAHATPAFTSRTADARTGGTLWLKAETLQRTGSFKFRGAANAIAALPPAARAAGVIAFSSGNHAQAIACAARDAGIAAVILMPADAPAAKLAATRGYGAEVITFDRYTQDREAITQSIAAARGLTLIPPFDHPDVIAGAGTAALELFAQAGPLDLLIAPVGGGGLIAGCAIAAATLSPGCRVIGVEPATGNDAQQSLRAGRRIRIDTPHTIADGAQTQCVGALNFTILQALVADIVTADDTALTAAVQFCAERLRLVVEPTGCLGLAAVLTGTLPVQGLRTGIILSGGNVDPARLGALLGRG